VIWSIVLCTVEQLKSALLMSEPEFLQKFDARKPRHDDANIVFYGLLAAKSAAAVQIARDLGFKRLAVNFA